MRDWRLEIEILVEQCEIFIDGSTCKLMASFLKRKYYTIATWKIKNNEHTMFQKYKLAEKKLVQDSTWNKFITHPSRLQIFLKLCLVRLRQLLNHRKKLIKKLMWWKIKTALLEHIHKISNDTWPGNFRDNSARPLARAPCGEKSCSLKSISTRNKQLSDTWKHVNL